LALETLFREQEPTGEGILPSQEIVELINKGKIFAVQEIEDDQIQPSSIDLRLSSNAYRVRASFLPGKSALVLDKAKSSGMHIETIDISEPKLFEPGAVYIIQLMESLALPSNVFGVANPKSTTGRLDIFTRLITDRGEEFEYAERNYRGGLFVEVISQTFPIIVQAGMKLNQLRFGRGRKRAIAGDSKLREVDQEDRLVDADEASSEAYIDRGLRVTVDLQGNGEGVVAYRANKYAPPVDLSKVNYYDIDEFWTPIYRSEKRQLILEPHAFYILASKQRVRVRPDFAAELLPYDLASQEFRVHYAGFFDPGFGYGENGEIPGTRAVLEVRASQIPILLEHDQFVGRLNFYRMAQRPKKVYGGLIGSSYQQQGLALSKQFKREQQYSPGFRPGALAREKGSDEAVNGGRSRGQDSHDVDDDEPSTLSLAFPSWGLEHGMVAKERGD